MADPPQEAPLLGKELGGRYRVVRLLERGGMGTVYEGEQLDLGRKVAIKVLHQHLQKEPDLVERFRREAEAAARLGHPRIVQVTDFSAEPSEPAYLVMEYVEGSPLSHVMRNDGLLPPERVAHVAVQVLDALEAAHAAGIVHRDLKPSNIVLRSSAGLKDEVTLLDFGIAKLQEGHHRPLTADGSIIGTPAYMSPEQARGEHVDGRADIYALGVILFSALAGRLPYDSSEPSEIVKALLAGSRASLAELRPDLDLEFVGLVERALERDRDDRFSDARHMRKSLERWLRVVTPSTLPPPPNEHGVVATQGQGRRRRALWIGVSVIASLILLGVGLSVGAMYFAPERVVLIPWVSPAEPSLPTLTNPSDPALAPAPAWHHPRDAQVLEADAGQDPSPIEADAGTTHHRPRRRPPSTSRAPLRLVGLTHHGLYEDEVIRLDAQNAAVSVDGCLGRDAPGGEPPVWELEVDGAGKVRVVSRTGGNWPPSATECARQVLKGLQLHPPPSGQGGTIVLVFDVGR